MYKLRKLGLFHLRGLFRAAAILYDCGKDMAKKYDLHHWDNSRFKTWVIIFLCVLKNRVYLVCDEEGRAVATFQTHRTGDAMHFEKLATSPECAGRGIGSFCIEQIEALAKSDGCGKVCMEVYAPSEHAIHFYEHRGYVTTGTTKTLKYTEIKMEKQI
ncbi:MAG: GNAT family N-acetyltransferase [Clostridia bacterium]|nr:GNAT family N-acetyltransferase [Clostridia bacterium]